LSTLGLDLSQRQCAGEIADRFHQERQCGEHHAKAKIVAVGCGQWPRAQLRQNAKQNTATSIRQIR
jgi:hypothetical protein